jgi:hypothetical protein
MSHISELSLYLADTDTPSKNDPAPVPGTTNRFVQDLSQITSQGTIRLKYNATLAASTVIVEKVKAIVQIDCLLGSGRGSITMHIRIASAQQVSSVLKSFRFGYVLTGGAEWQCLKEVNGQYPE